MNRSNGIVKEFCDGHFKDLSDVPKAHKLYEEYMKKCHDLENQLSIVSTEVPTNINSALQLAQTTLDRSEVAIDQTKKLKLNVYDVLENAGATVASCEHQIFSAIEHDKHIKYLKWVTNIQNIVNNIENCLGNDLIDEACSLYKDIVDTYDLLIKNNSGCMNLIKFIGSTIVYWHEKILQKLEPEFLNILKNFGWPFLNYAAPNNLKELLKQSNQQGSSNQKNGSSTINFEKSFVNLLLLQLPNNLQVQENGVSNDATVLLPVKLLVKPLAKRFQYHFSGNKPTNAIGKPEWYLTQILNWVTNHVGLIEHSIQLIIDSSLNGKYAGHNAFTMFTQELLCLVDKKISHDLDILLLDDALFAHLVDEILLFDRELNAIHELVTIALDSNGPINLLCQPQCLQKWINTEKLCALNRLDDILSKPEAWKSKFGVSTSDDNKMDTHLDEEKVPECTDFFVTMLLTITDRYKRVSGWKNQLRFVDLQIDLLDNFRIRLTQVLKNEVLTNPLGQVHFAVVNAAYYVTNLLQEWSENLFFLEIQQKLHNEENSEESKKVNGPSIEDEPSFFSSILLLFKRLYAEACEQINNRVFDEFKNKTKTFIESNWLTRNPHGDRIMTVSRSACPMLQTLQQKLTLLEANLTLPLFALSWKNISEMIDKYLFKELIINNRFSAEGCTQVHFDLVRNLFPLLGKYTQKPENYFRRLKESCILLTLSKGNALLLIEVLTGNAIGTKPTDALKDLKVTLLPMQESLLILKLRMDLI